MTQAPSLLSIIALARSGALERAFQLFREAGFDRIEDDAKVLSVRGRLLKDRALVAQGVERKRLYLQSAASYARAAEIENATYPLINAATLALLAGRQDEARALANKVLDRCAYNADEPETPYYRAATRAEALLLLGRDSEAQEDLAEAISLAPRAFEDHASTLRQFALILGERQADKTWLDRFRPPRSLHFAGRMNLAPMDRVLADKIRAFVREERIGFGYGALAAGADILIAEALLDEGAELHVVLPIASSHFRDASVGECETSWARRFDAVIKAASSVQIVDRGVPHPSPPLLQLGAEVAMGRCVMQANKLMSEAVQLLLLDSSGPSGRTEGSSDWSAQRWRSAGRRQNVLTVSTPGASRVAAVAEEKATCLAAMLRLDMSSIKADELLSTVLPHVARVFTSVPGALHPPRWVDDIMLLSFETPIGAIAAASLIANATKGTGGVRIAGHYAVASLAENPFDRNPIIVGEAATLLVDVMRSTPRGAMHVTEHFAAALYAGAGQDLPRIEYVGDLSDDEPEAATHLYSVSFN